MTIIFMSSLTMNYILMKIFPFYENMVLCLQLTNTFSFDTTFWAQTDCAHFSSMLASVHAFLTTRVDAANGNLIRNLVKCNSFNLSCPLGTLLLGPSTKTC